MEDVCGAVCRRAPRLALLLSSPHGGADSAGSCMKQHTQSIASQGSLGVWNFYWNLVT